MESKQDQRVLQATNGSFFSWLPPQYAAMARGLALAIGMAILEALAVFLSGMDVSELPAWAAAVIPMAVFALRSLEAIPDRKGARGDASPGA